MFSVIVPCWNAARHLEQTIATLKAQTDPDWEAIFIDDGSTDATAEMIGRACREDRRISCIRVTNGGPSRTRNLGAIRYASGEILAFLDADDLWAPEKLALMRRAFDRPEAPTAVFSRVAFFRESPDRVRTISTITRHPLTPRDLLGENAVCTMSNVAVRSDAFRSTGGFDPSIVHGEDVEWLIRLAASGAKIQGLPQTLVWYRANDFGLSADLDAMRAGWRAAMRTALRLGVAPGDRQIRAAEAVHLRYLARRALRIDAPRLTALRFALAAMRCSLAGFFSDARRGGATLAGALAAPFLPKPIRRKLFAD
jgi:glycosyltransferase involved in cell wall biosynthesis